MVFENIGPCLRVVAREAGVDIGIDQRNFARVQPAFVKPAEIFPIRFTFVNVPCVFGEENQKCLVPVKALVLAIKEAQRHPKAIERFACLPKWAQRGGRVRVASWPG